MKITVLFRILRRANLFVLGTLLSFSVAVPAANGVTRFGMPAHDNGIPPSPDFNEIWFYDDEMVKVLPRIDLQWVSVVFESGPPDAGRWPGTGVDEGSLRQWAEAAAADHSEVTDYFCDPNLSTDACFLQLRKGIDRNSVANLIHALNSDESVSYTHPAIIVNNKTFAFFNAINLEWKSGVSSEVQDRIMEQAHLSFDEYDRIHKVDIFQIPFFKALRLLAEDIHILRATPYLVELRPGIEAELILPISGSHVGDKVPFTLNVTFSDAVSIDPSSIATLDVRLAGIQKDLLEVQMDPYDHVEKAATSPIRITGWLRIFTPGEFFILPVRINYTCLACPRQEVKSIETEILAFRVSSLVPAEQKGAKLIVPEDILEPDYPIDAYHRKAKANLVLSLSSFLMAGLFLGQFVRRVQTEGQAKEGESVLAKEELMAEKLESFLQQEPPEPHWSYLGELSKMLREYLVLRFDLEQDPFRGTGTMFFESAKGALPASQASSMENFFRRIDDIVAREVAKESGVDAFRFQAMEIIDQMGRSDRSSD